MKVRIGDYAARCPYCEGDEFVPDPQGEREAMELTCASCGGAASRRVLLEILERSSLGRRHKG